MNTHDITVAVIGYGAIGQALCAQLIANTQGTRFVGVLTRSGQKQLCPDLPSSVAVVASIDELISLGPDIVVEAAGQDALVAFAPVLLDARKDVMAISTGALARPGFLDDLLARARHSGARLVVPAGAIAGLDGLGAHRIAGLTSVVYTSVKPPIA